MYKMAKKIYMDINFDTKKATLTGLKEQPVIRTITESKIFKDRWKFCYYFDLPIGENQEKWTFSWSQLVEKEQYFKLEQCIPFSKNPNLIEPQNYNPWTTLASWCYIMHPCFGIKYTDTIYCNEYHPILQKKYDIVFSVKGKPCIKEWSTEQSAEQSTEQITNNF